ncbi:MAG: hypothetical protein WCS77_03060 [Elusimicrobiaceae bacterium]
MVNEISIRKTSFHIYVEWRQTFSNNLFGDKLRVKLSPVPAIVLDLNRNLKANAETGTYRDSTELSEEISYLKLVQIFDSHVIATLLKTVPEESLRKVLSRLEISLNGLHVFEVASKIDGSMLSFVVERHTES